MTERAPAAQAEEPPSVSRRFGRRQLIRAVVALAAVVGLSVLLYVAFGRRPGAR
ncbi:hypothetical protein [Streptomyces sp. NPDC007206]|uniref:hypothetical protein n=1 Tax=Streptomyces sp. NPDC007206 TaxID=3154317 RepID=UPI0033FB79A7